MFLMDPSNETEELPNFQELLKMYNLEVGYDRVYEKSIEKHAANNEQIILPDIQGHELLDKLVENNAGLILLESRSVNVLKNAKEYVETTELLKTSNDSIAQSTKSGGKNLDGPVTVAVSVENKSFAKTSKIVVVGDSDFVANGNLKQTNGSYFMIGAMGWLSEKPEDIYINPRSLDSTNVSITAKQALILNLVTIIFIPLLVLGFGIFIWIRRKNL